MFICVCNGITDRQVEEAIDAGARSLEDLSATLGVATGCGSCAAFTRQLLNRAVESRCPAQDALSLAA
jgi:bacterioferritin-associated ferredoxin